METEIIRPRNFFKRRNKNITDATEAEHTIIAYLFLK